MSFNEKIEELKLEGAALAEGSSSRSITCPWCHKSEGGSILTRSAAGLHYKCYHGSCPMGDRPLFIDSRGFAAGDIAGRVERPTNVYDAELYPLTPAQADELYQLTGIGERLSSMYRIMYNRLKRTFVYPIYNKFCRQIGVVDRSYTGRKPKALTFWNDDKETKLFYSLEHREGPIVVTEDIPSAIRVGEFIRSASILGSSPPAEVMRALARETDHLILWLDYDLWTAQREVPVPIQLKKKYAIMFKRFDVIISKSDPKNMTDAEIMRHLADISTANDSSKKI